MDNHLAARPTMEAASLRESRYRADIDGLRAIAIIAVVVYHAFPDLAPGGFVGVDIFFVISGYLISKIILSEALKGCFSFRRFYGRRVRRIFPSLIIVLVATIAVGNATLLKPEFDQLARHVVASTFFSQNFALLSETGYFDRASDVKPLLHLWSLSVEEQFYIAFPILIVLLKSRFQKLIPIVILAIGFASYQWGHHVLKGRPEEAFFLPHLRAWELLSGALLAATEGKIRQILSRHRWLPSTLSVGGIFLILYAIYSMESSSRFPGSAALWPVLGSVFIIAAGAEGILNRTFLGRQPFVWIGLISYPLYLWHWPILTYLRIFEGYTPAVATRVAAVGASFILAYLTYRFVETPLQITTFRRYPSASSLGLAVILFSVAAGAAFVIFGLFDQYRPKELASSINIDNFKWEGRFENEKCREQYPEIRSRFCNIAKNGPPTVALIGDSHAMSFYDGLAPVVLAHDGNLLNIGGYSCMPALNAPFHSTGLSFRDTECTNTINAGLRVAEREPLVTTVILAGRRFVEPLSEQRRAAAEMAFRETFDRLIAAGKKIIYVLDFPELAIDPRACIRSLPWITSDCSVNVSVAVASRQVQADFIAKLVEGYPDIKVIDPFDVLCSGESCPIIDGGRSLYIDRNHLSRDGAAKAALLLANAIYEARASSR